MMHAQPTPIPGSQYQYQHQSQSYAYDQPIQFSPPVLSRSITGMSWSDYPIDFVARSPMDSSLHTPCGSPPALFAPGSFGDSGYKLEQDYCKNFSCCGIRLPDLHDLITHFEESHVVLLAEDGRPILPSCSIPSPDSPASPIDSPVGPSTPSNDDYDHSSGSDAFLSGSGLSFTYDHTTDTIPINAQSLSPEDQYRLYTELRRQKLAMMVSEPSTRRPVAMGVQQQGRLTAFGFPQMPASPPQSAFVVPPATPASSSTLRVQTSFTSSSSSATTPATTPLTTPVQPSLPMPSSLAMSMSMAMGMQFDEYCGSGMGLGYQEEEREVDDDVMMDFDPLGDMDGSGHSSPGDLDLEFEDEYTQRRHAHSHGLGMGMAMGAHGLRSPLGTSPTLSTLSMSGLHRLASSPSSGFSTPTICLPPRMFTSRSTTPSTSTSTSTSRSKSSKTSKLKASTSVLGGHGYSVGAGVMGSTAAAVTAAMNAAARKRAREEKREARERERERVRARGSGSGSVSGSNPNPNSGSVSARMGSEQGVNGEMGMGMGMELRVTDETEAAMLAAAKAARKERERDFKCPLPACQKEYLNANGLKYHLNKGKCIFRDGVGPEVIRVNVEARKAGVAGSRLVERGAEREW